MDANEMSYLISYTDKISESYISTANMMVSEANTTEQSLSGQLMLLNTVILTASLIALGNSDLFKQLTPLHGILICLIFLLQIISIISGIFNYRIRERFFFDSSQISAKSAEIAQAKKYETLRDMRKKLLENDAKIVRRSSVTALRVQIASISASLFLFFILVVALLFNFNGIYNLLNNLPSFPRLSIFVLLDVYFFAF